MRIRALLVMPVVAAAILGVGASGASAATIFTTNAHAGRVPVGTGANSTWTATSVGTIDFTSSTHQAVNTCHSTLGGNVSENTDVRSTLEVTSATFGGPNCTLPFTPTLPWTITVLNHQGTSAPNTNYLATFDTFRFHLAGIAGLFSGNLTTGVTAIQPTSGTAPISLTLRTAGILTGPIPGTIDGRYTLTGTSANWSLT